jgi:predicted CXXCH cytochrome family protein
MSWRGGTSGHEEAGRSRWSGSRASGLGLVLVALAAPVQAQQDVANTLHNLSVSGPGAITATSEQEVCIFCHTPHAASTETTPLWNRNLSGAAYVPYDGPSVQANVGQPNGESKLCLSCHDGTIALGQVLNAGGGPGTIELSGTNPDGTMPSGATLISNNLLNDHPVSFVYDQGLANADGELRSPSTLTGPVQLKGSGYLQCTSCHDPHAAQLPKFLRKDAMGRVDNLCLTCHEKPGWSGSTHESSTEFWPAGQSSDRVQDHSCISCHAPHTDSGAERLLRAGVSGGQSAIEQTCFQCHQSAAAGGIAQDIEGEFSKASRHPITLSPGGHRPVFITRPPAGLPENVLLSPGSAAEDASFTDVSHVECVDCHNPHRVTATNRTEGMRGMGIGGGEIANVINDPAPIDGQPSSRQYPVCLRCHGDTYDQVIGTQPLASGAIPGNKRTQFQTTNSAFHPVAGPGRNTSNNLNAQLTGAGLTVSSVIKCTDCHNSDAYSGTTGRVPPSGSNPGNPVGPHGSSNQSILRAALDNSLPGPNNWNANNFALCFGCHSENRLMSRRTDEGARTNFYDDIDGRDNLHWVHLDDRADRSRPICGSCHYNIHSNVQAPNTQYNIDGVVYDTPPDFVPTRLVNFHPNLRGIGGRPKPEWWFDTSTKERRCYLQCHTTAGNPGGETMSGLPYRPDTGDVP